MLQVAAPIGRFPFIRKLQLHFPAIASNLAVILCPLLPGTAAAGAFFSPQVCFATSAVAALPTCNAAVLHRSPHQACLNAVVCVHLRECNPRVRPVLHTFNTRTREAKAGGSGV